MASDIRVDLIAGFRSSGKTTLLNRMATRLWQGERVLLMLNESGNTRPADSLPAGRAVEEWEGGCLCCTAGALLEQKLLQLAEQFRPDRMAGDLAETACISDVRPAFATVGSGTFRVEHVIYVLNAQTFDRKWALSGKLMARQLQDSLAVWLNHAESAGEALLARIRAAAMENNPHGIVADSRESVADWYPQSTLYPRFSFAPGCTRGKGSPFRITSARD